MHMDSNKAVYEDWYHNIKIGVTHTMYKHFESDDLSGKIGENILEHRVLEEHSATEHNNREGSFVRPRTRKVKTQHGKLSIEFG